ncbi:MAG: hypothetical protein KC731_19135 [Myxococcales bacterium]|nr:hypothetical protein [Myxococcales bacterium]
MQKHLRLLLFLLLLTAAGGESVNLPGLAPGTPTPTLAPTPQPTPTPGGVEPPPTPVAAEGPAWPLPAAIHPVIGRIPEDARRSYRTVAEFIATEERDPVQRVKALHDFVANHVAYDAPSYAAGRYPPQDAETVFRTGLGVCAGYAKLLAAMGKEIGIDLPYVVGDARTEGWELSGEGHAWNAVEIEGRWYLIDATWDAGYVNGDTFTKSYRTEYLFTPPKIFGVTHLPNDDRWQLAEPPLSRGEFLRQPNLEPAFYAGGLSLLEPTRSQTTVPGAIDILIDNPQGLFLLATSHPKDGGASSRCQVEGGPKTKVRCEFPADGRYTVDLFAAKQQVGSYPRVGELAVNSDG